MKNISRIALLAALFSISAPLFSQEPKANTKGYGAMIIGLPKKVIEGLFISIPETISKYSYEWAINKTVSKVSYLQDGRIAKNSYYIGLVSVYLTAAALAYKAYTKTPAASNNNDDVFYFNDASDTNNVQ